jgi:hypothetical protein
MQYLLLIYADEQQYWALGDEERDALHTEYGAFTQSIQESGAMVGGGQLQPTRSATSVRIRNGETLVTDGPFAETKEQLGGYYVVEAKDVDEAIALAEQIPSARSGTIEVRPLVPRMAETTA